jgi:hypothetical protein
LLDWLDWLDHTCHHRAFKAVNFFQKVLMLPPYGLKKTIDTTIYSIHCLYYCLLCCIYSVLKGGKGGKGNSLSKGVPGKNLPWITFC